jgi:hypothetical protein
MEQSTTKRRAGRAIWVSDRVWRWIAEKARHPLEDTPDSVLRRELGLPPNDEDLEKTGARPRQRRLR